MQQDEARKRRIAIIGIIVGAVVIALITLIIQNAGQSYHKPRDFIGNTDAKENTPAATGSSFIGYDNLVNVGVSLDQINALQKAFGAYKPTGATGTVIDISNSKLTPYQPDPHDPLYRPSIGAQIIVNQKTTYKIRFYYWGTSSVQLLIFDASGKTKLFDSKTVTE